MHSNIIGFNPLLAELPASPTRTFRKELEHYLQRYPDTEQLDIYLHDLNGQLRGKRLPIETLELGTTLRQTKTQAIA